MLIKWEFLGHNMCIHSNPRVTYCVPGTGFHAPGNAGSSDDRRSVEHTVADYSLHIRPASSDFVWCDSLAWPPMRYAEQMEACAHIG